MKKYQDYDWLLMIKKVLIVDVCVGKTNFLLRFCENSFLPTHISTQGVELKTMFIDVEGKKIKMEIWSGCEIFKNITTNFYKGAIGFFLIYSVNDKDTFNIIQNWMNTIKQYANKNVCIMLIGNSHNYVQVNKINEFNRQVMKEEGEALAKQFQIPFIEISAKDGTNVADSFQTALKLVKDNLEKEVQVGDIEQKQVLIIGDAEVGKTNILLRFCDNSFQPYHLSNIGKDFKIKKIERRERQQKCIFGTLLGAIMLVYSIDDKDSFNNINYYMNAIKQHASEMCVQY